MRIYRNRRTVFGFLILRKSGRASHIPRLNVLSGNYILASGDEAVDYYADLSSFTDDGYVIRQFGSQTMILGKTEDGLDRAVRYYLNSFINGESDYYVSGEDCMSHPRGFSYFPVSNIDYAAELSKWCEISTRVIVWLYPGTWYALPFTSSTVFNLLEDMKLLNGLGVYGIFVCPSYESASDGVIPYVLSKLFWNCNISEAERALYLERWNSFCEQTSDVVMSCGAGGATREYVDPFSDFDITADNPGVLSDSEYIVGRWYDIP